MNKNNTLEEMCRYTDEVVSAIFGNNKKLIMNKEQQDKNWNNLSEDGKQARIASYQELLKLQEEEANSYLIIIEDLKMLYGSHNLNYKPLTYEDVQWELFEKNCWLYDYELHEIRKFKPNDRYDPRICTSEKQVEKLLAINKLLNVAKYLNGDWKPDWEKSNENKWIYNLNHKGGIIISNVQYYNSNIVYFRTKELAEQAVQILGEETIRLALSNDY